MGFCVRGTHPRGSSPFPCLYSSLHAITLPSSFCTQSSLSLTLSLYFFTLLSIISLTIFCAHCTENSSIHLHLTSHSGEPCHHPNTTLPPSFSHNLSVSPSRLLPWHREAHKQWRRRSWWSPARPPPASPSSPHCRLPITFCFLEIETDATKWQPPSRLDSPARFSVESSMGESRKHLG